jgi:hypothetical protein
VLVYVDDIIVASSSQDATTTLLKNLEKDFALKDLGELHYFLSIEVAKINGGILLSQTKYVGDLLKKTGMLACKPIGTSLSISKKNQPMQENFLVQWMLHIIAALLEDCNISH